MITRRPIRDRYCGAKFLFAEGICERRRTICEFSICIKTVLALVVDSTMRADLDMINLSGDLESK